MPATWPSLDDRLAQWPGFRGAGGGLARAAKVPTAWEAGKGVVWKSEVPLPGMNSPVVWKDHVFLSGGTPDSREVYCFNAATGELRWVRITLLPDRAIGGRVGGVFAVMTDIEDDIAIRDALKARAVASNSSKVVQLLDPLVNR